jgi:hypothetical protein
MNNSWLWCFLCQSTGVEYVSDDDLKSDGFF